MKRNKLLLSAFLVFIILSISAFALAETVMQANISGYCYRAYTSSNYLARNSTANLWDQIRINCTSFSVDDCGLQDFYVKAYNSANGQVATMRRCEVGDTFMPVYESKQAVTKINFKVYNSNYYEEGNDAYQAKIRATANGILKED